MKILITGVNGQVGHALMRVLTEHELIGLTRQDCDLTNPDQIKQAIDQHQPELIINPAAHTKVDQAEDEPKLAFQINRDAPKVMAVCPKMEGKCPAVFHSGCTPLQPVNANVGAAKMMKF